ncbi:MAG: GNAT family N-acetyltransferase [Pseudoruegeria sp.]
MIEVRSAAAFDTGAMATLLNEIIKIGGTTAPTTPVTGNDIKDWIASSSDQSAWHVAITDHGDIVGFQWISPHENLPVEACDIATFVKVGKTGLGVGSSLFSATRAAADRLGYHWINATIREDNSGGLIYYQSRGFRDWHVDENVKLANGMIVSKISKRFDLK